MILVTLLSLFWVRPAFASSIIINEIMYDLPGSDTGREWIELYNDGGGPVTIIGGWTNDAWRIYNGSNRILSTTPAQGSMTLPSGGFTIIAQNAEIFLAEYPDFSGTVIQSSALSLQNTEVTVGLRIGSGGELFGSVIYNNTMGAGGDGNSLQRKSDGSWLAALPTPGNENASNSPTPTIIPTFTPSPTLSPTTAMSATQTPTSTSPSSTFIISSVPSSIKSTDSFSVTVQTTGLIPNSRYYLKGAFFKNGSTNYFGKTKVGDTWIKNSATYSYQLPINTDSQGIWNGQVEVIVDEEDSGFTGEGNYLFKLRRYKADGTDGTWSNDTTVSISSPSSQEAPATAPPSSTSLPTLTPKPKTQTKNIVKLASSSSLFKIPRSLLPKLASVSGVSTESSYLSQATFANRGNPLIVLGLILFLLGTTSIVYLKIKG